MKDFFEMIIDVIIDRDSVFNTVCHSVLAAGAVAVLAFLVIYPFML